MSSHKGNLVGRGKLLNRRKCLQQKCLPAWELSLGARSILGKCSWHLCSAAGYRETRDILRYHQ